jgi:hypothetical protein
MPLSGKTAERDRDREPGTYTETEVTTIPAVSTGNGPSRSSAIRPRPHSVELYSLQPAAKGTHRETSSGGASLNVIEKRVSLDGTDGSDHGSGEGISRVRSIEDIAECIDRAKRAGGCCGLEGCSGNKAERRSRSRSRKSKDELKR